jgi:hypothetical protein
MTDNVDLESDARMNFNAAPYPDELATLVSQLTLTTCPDWKFQLKDIDRGQGSTGLTFIVITMGYDSYHPELGQSYSVYHYFPVPPAAYDVRSWRRWLFERIHDVHIHELCEGFTINGEKPYAPSHGPGNDPYLIREVGTELDQKTSFRGVVKQ